MKFALPLIAIALLCGCAADPSVHQIATAKDMKARMDAGNVRVIHALNPDNYATAHIPGAVNVDYEKMTAAMLPANKDEALIFYCAGGMCPVGNMAANKAVSWGHTNVSVYEGGMKDWQSCGMPVAKGK